ncbi:restriction endonuclease [Clostridium baratii]|uniref:restriction endonuclease n=1 Tax=Clostridium baratii TaxID=1561 RepID=UPI0030D468A8
MNRDCFIKTLNEKYSIVLDLEDDDFVRYYFGEYFGIEIQINLEKDSFDIFYEFTYPLYATEEYEHESDVTQYYNIVFEKILNEKFLEKPDVSLGNYLGAPFDDVRIGYFGVEFDIKLVDTFIEAYDIYISLINDVENEDLESEDILNNLYLSKWTTFKDDVTKYGYIDNELYLKRVSGEVYISTILFEKEIKEKFNINELIEVDIDKQHYGKEYIMFKQKNNKIIAIDRKYYDEVINKIQLVEEIYDIKIYTDEKRYIYIKVNSIIAIIPLTDNINHARVVENNYLKEIVNSYGNYAISNSLSSISFDSLNDKIFEKLSFEFLNLEGYYDVHSVGKTNASDDGCDFYAKKKVLGLDKKVYIEQWIIQCKYTKSDKSLSLRKDISEVPDILEEKYADKYLLLTTGYLSPSAVHRIHSINSRKGKIIDYLAIDELKLALREYPQLLSQYNLLK